jgi:hypothetical protein
MNTTGPRIALELHEARDLLVLARRAQPETVAELETAARLSVLIYLATATHPHHREAADAVTTHHPEPRTTPTAHTAHPSPATGNPSNPLEAKTTCSRRGRREAQPDTSPVKASCAPEQLEASTDGEGHRKDRPVLHAEPHPPTTPRRTTPPCP